MTHENCHQYWPPQIELVVMGLIEMDKDNTCTRAKFTFFLPQKWIDRNHRKIFLREILKFLGTVLNHEKLFILFFCYYSWSGTLLIFCYAIF